jgi:hypothetical protein
MRLETEAFPGYLRVEVLQRETGDEGRLMGETIFAEQARIGLRRILLIVRDSPPISKVEHYKLSDLLDLAHRIPGLRLALVSDTRELYASHQHFEDLAKQRGIEARAFPDEASGVEWLMAPPPGSSPA